MWKVQATRHVRKSTTSRKNFTLIEKKKSQLHQNTRRKYKENLERILRFLDRKIFHQDSLVLLKWKGNLLKLNTTISILQKLKCPQRKSKQLMLLGDVRMQINYGYWFYAVILWIFYRLFLQTCQHSNFCWMIRNPI